MIPITRLIRLEENHQYGTFGVLLINTEVFCVTLEPADWFNQPDISSIPAQQYICRRIITPIHEETFEVMNVPGRLKILFHSGNIITDTLGCIILGQYFDKLKGNKAVLNSGKTFMKFMEEMKGFDSFHLTIKEEY